MTKKYNSVKKDKKKRKIKPEHRSELLLKLTMEQVREEIKGRCGKYPSNDECRRKALELLAPPG